LLGCTTRSKARSEKRREERKSLRKKGNKSWELLYLFYVFPPEIKSSSTTSSKVPSSNGKAVGEEKVKKHPIMRLWCENVCSAALALFMKP
jgi:hypothetical protein